MTGPHFLRLRVIGGAVIVPRPVLGDKAAGAGVLRHTSGGLVPVQGTGVRRRGREYVAPPPTGGQDAEREPLERAVYAGFLFAHYGHFLLESMGRLWFDALSKDTPIVWVAGTADVFTAWMTEMLDMLGHSGERVVVEGNGGPLEVQELLVPDQGFEVHRYMHPWLHSRLSRFDAVPDPERPRVWLSRSAIGDLAGVEEEPEIEERLQREGWAVVHPEQLRPSEQVALLAGASHVAGIEGSAFHTLVLTRGFRGTVDIFTRQANPNFELLAAAAGWDQVRHALPGGVSEVWRRPSGARDVRWSGVDPRAAARVILESSRRRG